MANSDDIYEKWRRSAARASEDHYTRLWSELVGAFSRIEADIQSRGFYQGLLVAYALVTGDSTDFVHTMVGRAAKDLIAS